MTSFEFQDPFQLPDDKLVEIMAMDLLEATHTFMHMAKQGMGEWISEMSQEDLDKLRALRINLITEEFQEYLKGEQEDNLVEIIDGLIDVIVIAWGTVLAYIGPERAQRAAEEVAKSNLSKVIGEGLPLFRDDGKVIKPEGWTPPDMAGAVWGS